MRSIKLIPAAEIHCATKSVSKDAVKEAALVGDFSMSLKVKAIEESSDGKLHLNGA